VKKPFDVAESGTGKLTGRGGGKSIVGEWKDVLL